MAEESGIVVLEKNRPSIGKLLPSYYLWGHSVDEMLRFRAGQVWAHLRKQNLSHPAKGWVSLSSLESSFWCRGRRTSVRNVLESTSKFISRIWKEIGPDELLPTDSPSVFEVCSGLPWIVWGSQSGDVISVPKIRAEVTCQRIAEVWPSQEQNSG